MPSQACNHTGVTQVPNVCSLPNIHHTEFLVSRSFYLILERRNVPILHTPSRSLLHISHKQWRICVKCDHRILYNTLNTIVWRTFKTPSKEWTLIKLRPTLRDRARGYKYVIVFKLLKFIRQKREECMSLITCWNKLSPLNWKAYKRRRLWLMPTLHSSVVTVCTARLNIKTCAFYPDCVLHWLVSFWQQTAVISIGNTVTIWGFI